MKAALDLFYDLLARLGYSHPLHAAVSHMPIALPLTAFFMLLVAIVWRRSTVALSAHHAFVAALLFYFPTVLFGITDWQRFYGGAWLPQIKIKIALAAALLPVLVIGVLLGRKSEGKRGALALVYTCAVLGVGALGYYGGDIVFGAKPAVAADLQAGEKLFTKNCAACHLQGGNIITVEQPLLGSKYLQNLAGFTAYLRHPTMTDGSTGAMPPYPPDALTDPQVKDLHDYVKRTFSPPN
jgi:mono/diheme cytochrome c family protein